MPDEGGPAPEGPAIRLLRLWIWSAPLGMLALAIWFGALAAGEERWALLAVMVLLALAAVGLFALQWRLMRRLRGGGR